MLTVAYLANEFPSAVEPYVVEEIEELRRLGVHVIAGSVRKTVPDEASGSKCAPQVVLRPPHGIILLCALWLCIRRMKRISPLISLVLFHGREGPIKRIKALAHTWLGACYAVLLAGSGIKHIHVHHGYLGSWIAMVAARLLDVEFSMTLHGSDLLLHGAYLDTKLKNCMFCLTVSEYNRNYILEHYPKVDPEKVVVARLGVEVRDVAELPARRNEASSGRLTLLAVGRLHAVKDHAFLIRACAQLCGRKVNLECAIAGEGPERRNLELLIRKCGLEERVKLLGHVPRERMDSFYGQADVVVLTSRSEGIPLVLMEAMARGKIVLAPAITGIPELVIPGKTGFLYEAGSMDDFVARLLLIGSRMPASEDSPSAGRRLDQIRHAARMQVCENFNRRRRLESFGGFFLRRVSSQAESAPHEDFVLQ
ncbi:MAG: glycosyltransferase family 4 protein [Candidatus Sulfotelmatobacter sp.]